jgi:hypothetical protein
MTFKLFKKEKKKDIQENLPLKKKKYKKFGGLASNPSGSK